MIYIKNKPSSDCNGVEKYVKECIEHNDISFFPIQESIALNQSDDEN